MYVGCKCGFDLYVVEEVVCFYCFGKCVYLCFVFGGVGFVVELLCGGGKLFGFFWVCLFDVGVG